MPETVPEIRASLERLRASLALATPGSPAAAAFAAAVARRERELASLGEGA